MRAKSLLVVVLVVVGFGACTALAQDADQNRQAVRRLMDIAAGRTPKPHAPNPDPESPKAAGRYVALFKEQPKGLYEQASWVVYDPEIFGVSDNEDGITAASARKALEDAQPWIKRLCEAAALKDGDLRLGATCRDAAIDPDDPGQGLTKGLLHASRILRADAVRLWSSGKKQEALERDAALLGMAHHLAEERHVMMACLLSEAILGVAAAQVEGMRASTGATDLPRSPTLLTALERFDKVDPAQVRAAWRALANSNIEFAGKCAQGKQITLPLLVTLVEHRAAEEIAASLFGSLLAGKDLSQALSLNLKEATELAAKLREQIGGLTPEDVRGKTQRARALLELLDAVWEQPDVSIQLKAIQKEIDEDESGLLSLALFSPEAVHKHWAKSVEAIKVLTHTP